MPGLESSFFSLLNDLLSSILDHTLPSILEHVHQYKMMAMARYVRHEASCLSLTVVKLTAQTKKQCFLGISCSPPWRTCHLMQEDKMEEVREVLLEILNECISYIRWDLNPA
ncbi:hypothetical protein NC651_009095 [Populus alba x Populus x berolinensis]|nr:hypothetical protein NC651_009095 [Populus alba x Populus x berolinensis]